MAMHFHFMLHPYKGMVRCVSLYLSTGKHGKEEPNNTNNNDSTHKPTNAKRQLKRHGTESGEQ